MKLKQPELWPSFVKRFPDFMEHFCSYKKLCAYISKNIDDTPNILLYSSEGFPLNLLWNHVATLKWGACTKKECQFGKSVMYTECPYYLEIDFEHPSNSRAIDEIQDFLKTIITTSCIHAQRHVILCRNIDVIQDKYAFRVLLERFNKNAMFVCTTHCISSIEGPIRSRFFEIRVPLFETTQVAEIMKTLCATSHIVDTRNILTAIYFANSHHKTVATYHHKEISDIPSSPTIIQLRDIANKVCIANMPFSLVVCDLLHRVPEKRKCEFVAKAAEIEHRMVQTNLGRKPLYYELLFHVAFHV